MRTPVGAEHGIQQYPQSDSCPAFCHTFEEPTQRHELWTLTIPSPSIVHVEASAAPPAVPLFAQSVVQGNEQNAIEMHRG